MEENRTYLAWARDFFQDDHFAMEAAGIVIEAAEPGRARCSLPIERRHLNADGHVMGGVSFTLADLTAAVAANAGQPHTVAVSSSITFLGVAKGQRLIAEAKTIKAGRTLCTCEVRVTDELETPVAHVTLTGMRVGKEHGGKG